METSWERGEPIQEMSLEEIRELLAPAGVNPGFATRIEEGKANTNYLIGSHGTPQYILRLHTRDPKSAKLEKAVTDLLLDEVPVAKVVFHSPEPPFSLLEWKPGETMERLLTAGRGDQVAAAAHDLGVALAKISQHHFPAAGFLAGDLTVAEAWTSTVDGLMGYFEWLTAQPLVIERVGKEIAESVHQLSTDTRPRLAEVVGPPCLVHGDYKASNLLIHEGRLSAVLDWEFAHSGTYLMSIGQIFRHPVPPGFEEKFVQGFESQTHLLPEDWRHLAKVIDLLSMLDFLNRPSAGPTLIADVPSIIKNTLPEPLPPAGGWFVPTGGGKGLGMEVPETNA